MARPSECGTGISLDFLLSLLENIMKYMKYVLLFLVLAGVVFSSFSYSSAVNSLDDRINKPGYVVGDPISFDCKVRLDYTCWFPGVAPGQRM